MPNTKTETRRKRQQNDPRKEWDRLVRDHTTHLLTAYRSVFQLTIFSFQLFYCLVGSHCRCRCRYLHCHQRRSIARSQAMNEISWRNRSHVINDRQKSKSKTVNDFWTKILFSTESNRFLLSALKLTESMSSIVDDTMKKSSNEKNEASTEIHSFICCELFCHSH